MGGRIEKALTIAYKYAGIDGSHHKQWVIDQMVRALTEEGYDQWVSNYVGEYDEYVWEQGIAP